jgi:hypothetical protein
MSPRPKTDLPLATKVANVLRAVKRLKRQGHNDDGDYDYTRATDVFSAVRDRLFAQGVLLLPNEGDPVYVPIQTNEGIVLTECRLPVTYTFKDAKEELPPLRCNGIGRTADEKALYIAQTGAEKAFLKRIGLMAEKIDDPEFDRNGDHEAHETGESIDDVAPMRVPNSQKPVTDSQIRAFNEACAANNKSMPEIVEYLTSAHKASTIAELKRGKPFTDAIRWASNGAGTLAPKPPALQGSLPLPRPAPSFEMRVGGRTEVVQPKTGSYSI